MFLKKSHQIFECLNSQCEKHIYKYGAEFNIFMIFVLFQYLFQYEFLSYDKTYQDFVVYIRLLSIFPVIILFFRDYWNPKLKKYVSILWFLSLTVSLSFSGIFMCLLTNAYSGVNGSQIPELVDHRFRS